jgi:hypothetical protein
LPSCSRLVMRRCIAFDSITIRVLTSIACEYPQAGRICEWVRAHSPAAQRSAA